MFLYVETNFIISAARDQEAQVSDLLKLPTTSLRILLPDICIMEAQMTIDKDINTQRLLIENLKQQRIQLERDFTLYSHATITSLKQTELELSKTSNTEKARFRSTLKALATRVELVSMTQDALLNSLQPLKMRHERDNLILAVILDDAARRPQEEKAFLTSDNEFREPAQQAGLRHFTRTEAFLGWFHGRDKNSSP